VERHEVAEHGRSRPSSGGRRRSAR
jgi:hypothetical protein